MATLLSLANKRGLQSLADGDTPTPSAKKSKRSTPRPKLPLRPPTQDEIVVATPVLDDAGASNEVDGIDESIYETPATQNAGSIYTTPATHLIKKTNATNDTTPSHRLNPNKARHQRFTSEEPPDTALNESPPTANKPGVESTNDVQDDDSDEAPEAVTTKAAAQAVRKAQAGAAKARKAQEDATRNKRRDRNMALAEQARNTDGRRSKHPAQEQCVQNLAHLELESSDHDDNDDDDDNVEEIDGGRLITEDTVTWDQAPNKLPKYLPQELLDAAPAIRPLSPPITIKSSSLAAASRLNKLALLDPKQPKDITRGPVKVRVMQDIASLKFMPPKAERKKGTQREVRDTWMLGRQGRFGSSKGVIGSGKVERRSWGKSSGFLRR